MNSFFFIIITLVALAVGGVLVLGILGMAKGGAFNEKYGNKLMQARIILQGVAVALVVLALLFSHK